VTLGDSGDEVFRIRGYPQFTVGFRDPDS